MPNLFKISRPIIDGKNPLIISGNLLQVQEVHVLPIVRGLQPRVDETTKIKMYATLAGYSLLEKILKTNPKDYSKLIWTPCQEIPVWIGSVNYEDTLEDLLRVFDVTGFGDAAAEGRTSIPALVTLSEIIDLYRNGIVSSKLRASEVGSKMISLPANAKLIDALRLMFQKRIRRIFIHGNAMRSTPRLEYISGRDIIRFLFSPERLDVVKNSPTRWLDAMLEEMETSKAKPIFDGRTINQAAKEIDDGLDACLLCEKSKKVVTKWDLVMKPFKRNGYSLLAA
jgi:hypothetical protein